MLLTLGLLVAGLTCLVLGGDGLVRGASALAVRFGVPTVVIGLTIVAFGTSAPELTVNLVGAIRGTTELSFGNIVGSNIANIGIIIGIAALIRPLTIHSVLIVREIPMVLLTSLAMLALYLDQSLDGAPALFSRTDGMMLMLLFGVFMYYTIGDVVRGDRGAELSAGETTADSDDSTKLQAAGLPAWLCIIFIIGGLGLLVFGGSMTVRSAVILAEAVGVPEVVVGLSVVAIGTSLPELATSIIATVRGQTDIAVGNVVGSNIFNVLFIMGISSSVTPAPLPDGGMIDLFVMLAISIALLPLAMTHGRRIVRWEGAVLLIAYLAYLIWRGTM